MTSTQIFLRRVARRWHLALVLALMTGTLAACNRSDPATEQPFSLAKYEGQWLVLNYWAEWCLPCLEEIPEFNKLAREHEGEITVLGVNYDRVADAELDDLSEKMGIEFEVLQQDPADTLKLARPAALPTTYLYAPSGKLAAKLVGPQSSGSILARMQRLAPGAANPAPKKQHPETQP